MTEGFDVGLEMSGNAQAFRDLLANMCTHFFTDAFSLIAAYALAHHLVHLAGSPAGS